jgi:hypothetical protein
MTRVGLPRQRKRKRSAAVSPLETISSATRSGPRADWATIEIIVAESRARSSRASVSVISMSCFRPHWPASAAVADWRSAIALPVFAGRSTFSARGIPGSKLSSTRRPQTFS